MTPEEIKELANTSLGKNEIIGTEVNAVYYAAHGDPFWLICYAYKLGFQKGQQAKADRRRAKSPQSVSR